MPAFKGAGKSTGVQAPSEKGGDVRRPFAICALSLIEL